MGTAVREREGVGLQGAGDRMRCIFDGVLLLTDVQCATATVYKGAEEVRLLIRQGTKRLIKDPLAITLIVWRCSKDKGGRGWYSEMI